MTAPVKWNILFAIVNLIQIVRLLRGNRKVPLCLEETFLKDTIFHSLRALEIKSVFQLATVQSCFIIWNLAIDQWWVWNRVEWIATMFHIKCGFQTRRYARDSWVPWSTYRDFTIWCRVMWPCWNGMCRNSERGATKRVNEKRWFYPQ